MRGSSVFKWVFWACRSSTTHLRAYWSTRTHLTHPAPIAAATCARSTPKKDTASPTTSPIVALVVALLASHHARAAHSVLHAAAHALQSHRTTEASTAAQLSGCAQPRLDTGGTYCPFSAGGRQQLLCLLLAVDKRSALAARQQATLFGVLLYELPVQSSMRRAAARQPVCRPGGKE